MIDFDFIAAFDPESVVPGDMLRRRGSVDVLFVVGVNADGEEVLCVSANSLSRTVDVKQSSMRIGYENFIDYVKIVPKEDIY